MTAHLDDDQLLEVVQRETFRYFWEGAHPQSGLALDRCPWLDGSSAAPAAVGGTGFGVLALLVACHRGWISRALARGRLELMLDCLEQAERYHGIFPHFMQGDSGATVPFTPLDDGADLVETSFLFQGLLAARAYFDSTDSGDGSLRERITRLWEQAEWSWHVQPRSKALTWHWSPNHGFALNHEIHGWNEALVTYVLAAGSPRYAISPDTYDEGWATGPVFLNGRRFEGTELPLGPDWGGPLFFAHFSFCGLDPRGLTDAYADYWRQNVNHTLINYAWCVRNPLGYQGYGSHCWGLSASDTPEGYAAHAPDDDRGVITPAAALSSLPYTPRETLAALRHFYEDLGDRLFGRFGFLDAFSEQQGWYADWFVAINQGPTVAMIENHRSGFLWKLFMAVPEVQAGLKRLGFRSPQLG